MQINKIRICNFGSYEGETEFDFCITNPEKNVILIGGKNGSGKTTLFSAIKIALYGPVALGYETTSPSYYRTIKGYINNNSLTKKNVNTSLYLDFSLEEERGVANYSIDRQWVFEDKKLNEIFQVQRNGELLDENDINTFESYIQFLIPPQLFELFFFDGEKISEFFLNGNSSKNLKDAFLILSGFDTFDIIKNNFKRYFHKGDSALLSEEEGNYAGLLQKYEENQNLLQREEARLNEIEAEIKALEESCFEVQKQFRNAGGLLAEEIEKIKAEIIKEEKYREERHEWLKDFANDFLPFLMTKDLVQKVKGQVVKEHTYQKYMNIKEILDESFLHQVIFDEIGEKELKITNAEDRDFSNEFVAAIANHIDNQLKPDFDVDHFEPVHMLSHDEESDVLTLIKQIEKIKITEIKKCRDSIARSILKGQELKSQLDASQNNDYLTNFLNQLSSINAKIQTLTIKKERGKERVLQICDENLKIEHQKKRAGELLSKIRKDDSVISLCSQGLALLEDFIPQLIDGELDGVKERFLFMFNRLISKQNYVDEIDIDTNFNITLYRNTLITTESLENIVIKLGTNGLESHLGKKCIEKLKNMLQVRKDEEIEVALKNSDQQFIPLATKVDINSFSKGEQQIYIMSLYWAIVKLSKHDIPFIIDTPYARIDSMHRENITTKFFPSLSSQVIILSTDEEVNAQYYELLNPFLAKEYTIIYLDQERRTKVDEKYFFEVAS
jgi:DNA sulfur modification protein DndD